VGKRKEQEFVNYQSIFWLKYFDNILKVNLNGMPSWDAVKLY